MSFADHLDNFRNPDGSYDLAGAEAARAAELADDVDAIDALALKAAKSERAAWERANGDILRKQMTQPALTPELDLDVVVPLGKSTGVRLGDMTRQRIQIRKDMRTEIHIRENQAFDAEMTFWMGTERLLDGDETIEEGINRSYGT